MEQCSFVATRSARPSPSRSATANAVGVKYKPSTKSQSGEYGAPENDVGYYDTKADPLELKNIAATLPKAKLDDLHKVLQANATCTGTTACWAAESMAMLPSVTGTSTCQNRSPVRSELREMAIMAMAEHRLGRALT